MEYTKEQAVEIAIKCGKEYKKKLAETKVLFLYRDKTDNGIKALEIAFRPSNYQHLTGILLVDKNGNVEKNCAVKFYHKCADKKASLSAKEIKFKDDGTTPLKLHALPYIMDITKITKICGEYNKSKPSIEADALVGSIYFSLAISKYEDSEIYFPRSGLMEDIRTLVAEPSQVIAIFQKNINDSSEYSNIKYVAKGINLATISLPENIQDIISLNNLHCVTSSPIGN